MFLLLLQLALRGYTQQCTNPGQTPVTATLVCGSETFNLNTVQFCGQQSIPAPCNDGATYLNSNPNFLRMACYAAGTLGFVIVPNDPSANYSWQLFDVTGTNPIDVFTNAGLFVACNWSSEPGETGASSDGTSLTVCSGSGQPLFSQMPDLQVGHTYLLMIVNLSNSTAGYQLTFTGGTAVITDNINPHLQAVRTTCDGNQLVVRFNKQLLCGSLAADGSDFTLSSGASIISAVPSDCSSPFGTDSVILTLDQPLSNGNYTLTMAQGNDGNTLSDVCNRDIPVGETVPFVVSALQPTPLDSIYPVACSPASVDLIFKKRIRCPSLAPPGRAFLFPGPPPFSSLLSSATINGCVTRNTTSIVRLNLSSPLVTGGIYTIRLATGTDGNTILDECGLSTAAGASVSFTVPDTVSAAFTHTIIPSCKTNAVSFLHTSGNPVTNWQWDFGDGTKSTIANPSVTYNNFTPKTVKLTVSNGICSNTYSKIITTGGPVIAAFDLPAAVCPGDPITITNISTGNINTWQWDFGNGNTSNSQIPSPQLYIPGTSEKTYTIRLIAGSSSLNCSDTAIRIIKVPVNCVIAVPSAFSPNGDGRNDFLAPLNAEKADDVQFSIYNRYGQLVFRSAGGSKKWDGRFNGALQNTGVYAWLLQYTVRDTGKKVFIKGTVVLLR